MPMLRLSVRIASRIALFFAGIAFAVVCFIALNAAMVPVSTSQYCGGKCHEMNAAYLSWELSPHGANAHGIRVECTDCHLPPKEEYFAHVAMKAYEGAKDVYVHYLGDPYDLEESRKRVLSRLPNRRCLHCHDRLLDKPGDSAARIAHTAALAQPGAAENRCVGCHEDAGHQRQRKLFQP